MTDTRRQLVIAAIAVGAAVGGILADCSPTGAPIVDGLLTAALAAATVWLSASASWWVLVVVGGVAAAAAGTTIGLLVALVGASLGLGLGLGVGFGAGFGVVPVRCLSAAIVVQVLLRLQLHTFLGASALVAGSAFVLLIGESAQRRESDVRRRIVRVVLVAAGAALLAGLGFGAAVASTRNELRSGYQGVLDGLSLLQSGESSLAARSLHDAADDLRAAQDSVDAPWAQPARLLPVVAQHRNALTAVVGEAADAADAAADALDAIDLDSLTIDGGVIDVQSVADLAGPLADLHAAVEALRTALDDADSPWLIGPVRDRLDRYQTRASKAAEQAKATATAAAIGPAMLGSEGVRHYLIAFCSPAEARGAGGVMGNYAVITIDHGAITRTGFGRGNELGDEIERMGAVPVQVTPEFLARYTRYGFDEAGAATRAMWSNATMTPDLPSAAVLMAQLWVGTGHEELDGVFVIDPAGLAALLETTGPIIVEGLDAPLDSSNLERFLLLDQYRADTPERTDLLAQVAAATLDAILVGQLPGPQVIARDLGPAATSGHISVWARRADEQELMRLIGVDAALPTPESRDGFAVVTNNATANKIDTFLERTVRYEATVNVGAIDATMEITLRNTAPTSGYPDYVLGSEFLDLPNGTNRTLLTLYSPLAYDSATLDGRSTSLTTDAELGWNVYTLQLDLAPGETRTIVVSLSGRVSAGSYSLVVRPQPMANDDTITIEVTGDVRISYTGDLTRRSVIDEHGVRALR